MQTPGTPDQKTFGPGPGRPGRAPGRPKKGQNRSFGVSNPSKTIGHPQKSGKVGSVCPSTPPLEKVMPKIRFWPALGIFGPLWVCDPIVGLKTPQNPQKLKIQKKLQREF